MITAKEAFDCSVENKSKWSDEKQIKKYLQKIYTLITRASKRGDFEIEIKIKKRKFYFPEQSIKAMIEELLKKGYTAGHPIKQMDDSSENTVNLMVSWEIL